MWHPPVLSEEQVLLLELLSKSPALSSIISSFCKARTLSILSSPFQQCLKSIYTNLL
jgi:hypothetical protein